MQYLAQEEWFQNVFLIGSYGFRKNPYVSDKNVITQLKKMPLEQAVDVSPGFILKHLVNFCPSTNRFNIFHNKFNFLKYSDKNKALLISGLFFTGRAKVFERSLELLLDEKVFKELPIALHETFMRCITLYTLNNNISKNCEIFKKHLSTEDFDNIIAPMLERAILDKNQKSINAIFCQSLTFENTIRAKQLSEHFIDLLSVPHSIDFNNSEFYSFYEKNNLKDRLFSFSKIYFNAKNDTTPFLDYLSNNNLVDNFLEKDNSNTLHIESVGSFEESELVLFKNKLDKYYLLLDKANDVNFLSHMTNIANNKNIFTLEEEERKYYKSSFIDNLNLRLNSSDKIKEGIPFVEAIEQYSILKEKEVLLGIISTDTINDKRHALNKKRL